MQSSAGITVSSDASAGLVGTAAIVRVITLLVNIILGAAATASSIIAVLAYLSIGLVQRMVEIKPRECDQGMSRTGPS